MFKPTRFKCKAQLMWESPLSFLAYKLWKIYHLAFFRKSLLSPTLGEQPFLKSLETWLSFFCFLFCSSGWLNNIFWSSIVHIHGHPESARPCWIHLRNTEEGKHVLYQRKEPPECQERADRMTWWFHVQCWGWSQKLGVSQGRWSVLALGC